MYSADEVEFDSGKDEKNQDKHDGLSLQDGLPVLEDPYGLTIEDPDATKEQRFITIGMDAFGEILLVCWTDRDDRVRIISTRNTTPSQRKTYYARRL